MLDLPRNVAGLVSLVVVELLEAEFLLELDESFEVELVELLAPHKLSIIVLDPGRMMTPELHASSLVPSPLFMLNIMLSTVMSMAVDRYMAMVTSRSCPNRWSNE